MSETPWVVRFVDRPDPDRRVRLDLNDEQAGGNVYVRPDGFTLGVGEVEVASSGSMLVDGETVTASRRVNREPVIPLCVVGESPDVARVLNALARELDRDVNYLEFKPSDHTGEPVFLTVLPGSDFGEVDLDPDDYPDEKGVQVNLLCEPVGVGLTQTGTATVNNDPAAASNPQQLTLPSILGDLPAPLVVQASWTTSDIISKTLLLNQHAHPTASQRIIMQAETAAGSNSTSLQANDPAMSGAGSNFMRCSFTNATLLARLQFAAPQTPGEYKLLLRVRKTVAADVFDLRYTYQTNIGGAGGSSVNGDTKTYGATSGVGPHWIDLGRLNLPAFGGTTRGASQVVPADLFIYAGRDSGTGSLDFDCLLLLPVDVPDAPDPRTAITWLDFAGIAATVTGVIWDGEQDAVITTRAGLPGWVRHRTGGALPRVHPGYNNYLTLMRHVGTTPSLANTNGDDVKGDTTDVTWSYRPRWMYLSAP